MAKHYIHGNRNNELTRQSADIIIGHLTRMFQIDSVLDVGCGVGFFCEAFLKSGIIDVTGVDGDYLNRQQLVFPAESFYPANLAEPLDLRRKFDLVVCLEVVEHLPASAASTAIASLCRHGDLILFSAATPQQGGQGHVNEQWIPYWSKHFGEHGFQPFDLVRPHILNDQRVQQWYRHNSLVYANDTGLSHINQADFRLGNDAIEYFLAGHIHPRLAWRALKASALRRFRERFSTNR